MNLKRFDNQVMGAPWFKLSYMHFSDAELTNFNAKHSHLLNWDEYISFNILVYFLKYKASVQTDIKLIWFLYLFFGFILNEYSSSAGSPLLWPTWVNFNLRMDK